MIAGLYVADFGDVIKVGRTGSPASRLKQLAWEFGRPAVYWVWLGPVNQPAAAEAELVAEVGAMLEVSQGSEWFRVQSAEDFALCVSVCESVVARYGYAPSAMPRRRDGMRPVSATITAGAATLTACEDGSIVGSYAGRSFVVDAVQLERWLVRQMRAELLPSRETVTVE